jgi:hypothetical protein
MSVVQTSSNADSPLFEERRWTNLVEQIAANTCTPFIGAGASAYHLPMASALSTALAEEFGYPLSQGRDDLLRVSEYMAVKHESGNFPKLILAKFFNLDRVQTPEELSWNPEGGLYDLYRKRVVPSQENALHSPHSILASLPVSSFLTTNYDLLMSKALRARMRDVSVEFCRWSGKLRNEHESRYDSGWRSSIATPVVYHLHGHANIPESIVATEDDYTDFIVNIGRDLAVSPTGKHRKCALPIQIRDIMRNHTLLFIGYRVADTNLRVVLRTLRSSLEMSDQKVHIAVQLRPEAGSSVLADIEKWQQYLQDYYQWSLRITVFWGDVQTFTSELGRRLRIRGLV